VLFRSCIVVVLLFLAGVIWLSWGRSAGSERLGQINPNNPPITGPLGVREMPPSMAGGPGSAPSAGTPGAPGRPPLTGAEGTPPPPGGLPGPPAGLPGPHGAPQGSGMPGPPSIPPIGARGGR